MVCLHAGTAVGAPGDGGGDGNDAGEGRGEGNLCDGRVRVEEVREEGEREVAAGRVAGDDDLGLLALLIVERRVGLGAYTGGRDTAVFYEME